MKPNPAPKKHRPSPKRPRGRPTVYSEALGEKLCERISQGSTLRQVCEAQGMPSRATVYRWANESEAFRDALARAREARAETWVDALLDVSLEAIAESWRLVKLPGGSCVMQALKLQADTFKFLIARNDAKQVEAPEDRQRSDELPAWFYAALDRAWGAAAEEKAAREAEERTQLKTLN